ncbi:MAG: class I SAM-dependent methyltransferase [Haliangium ochraceum]
MPGWHGQESSLEESVYAVDARLERDHWWYVGRRKLFARLISALGVAANEAVLDIGTSSGTNLRMLRDIGFTDVSGLDFSEEAIRFCAEKGLGTVRRGDITDIPFSDHSFSLVLATDIIEHVDDDARALQEVARVLRPGRSAIITVPAFPSLWGFQDDVSQHKRRYRMEPLLQKIRAAGLEPRRQFHFNYLLFGPIWAARQLMKVWPHPYHSESEVNTPLLNQVLTAIFNLDIAMAPRFAPPFGVSILVVASKPPLADGTLVPRH